jgi:hypothetical protein
MEHEHDMTETMDIVTIEEINCVACGIRFGMPKSLLEQRRRDHRGFYCPNGHPLEFPKPKPTRDEELALAQSALHKARAELKLTKDDLVAAEATIDQLQASRRPLFRRRGWVRPSQL